MAPTMAPMEDEMARTAKAGRDYGAGGITQEHVKGCPPAVIEPDGKRRRPPHDCKGPWVATIEAGWTEKGTRRRLKVKAKTEAEVKVRLRQRRRLLELAGGSSVSPRDTVKKWAEEWLPIVERKQSPNTHNTTRIAVRKWIVPTIGHKRFDQLAPADVRAVTSAIRAAGRSSSTQLRYYAVLIDLLRAARREGYPVHETLLDAGDAPVPAISTRTDMGVENAVKLLELAAQRSDGSRWVAALLQGHRQGEALGMTWPEIDLDRGRMQLSWQLQPLPYRERYNRESGFRVPDGYEARQVEGRLHLVRPKSKAGWRVTPLVPWMKTALEAWRETAPVNEHELVWPTPDGRPRTSKADDADWYALQAEAGVSRPDGTPYTVHEARHTTATLLLEAGIDAAVIIAVLGHSKITTSRSYMHVNVEGSLDALSKVATRLKLD